MAALNEKDFMASVENAKKARIEAGKNAGFVYTDWRHRQPAVWFDQLFCAGAAPSGTVTGAQAIKVGNILGADAVALIASGGNTADLTIPAGASFACTILGSETEEGTYTACYAVTVHNLEKAVVPAGGQLARFPLPQACPRFIKANVAITGSVTGGGTVDIALVINAGRVG